jgi:hypothetical protein
MLATCDLHRCCCATTSEICTLLNHARVPSGPLFCALFRALVAASMRAYVCLAALPQCSIPFQQCKILTAQHAKQHPPHVLRSVQAASGADGDVGLGVVLLAWC